jgi:hypothetical protein
MDTFGGCYSAYHKYQLLVKMRWLLLYVNLTGLRDTQIAGRILFLDMPVRVFPEEINI